MIRLIEPTAEYLPSYTEARDEYIAHGVSAYGLADARTRDVLAHFERYRQARDLPPDRVGADYYWLVDDERAYFIGEISVRHELTPFLERYGGHIGYCIRYSEWNRGYGTLMLSLALEKARARGLRRVLITCDDDNIGSARVMEKNGCVLADKVDNVIDGQPVVTRRYWRELDE